MRQVGILCAAALVAVQENVEKLEGDHKNAKILAGRYTSPFDLHAIAIGVKTNYFHFFCLVQLLACATTGNLFFVSLNLQKGCIK
jgi:threonine aldolase